MGDFIQTNSVESLKDLGRAFDENINTSSQMTLAVEEGNHRTVLVPDFCVTVGTAPFLKRAYDLVINDSSEGKIDKIACFKVKLNWTRGLFFVFPP